MEQPYMYAYPTGTGTSATPLPQGGGVAGVIVNPRVCPPYPYVYPYPTGMGPSAPPPRQGGGVAGVIVNPRVCAPYPYVYAYPTGTVPSAHPPRQGSGVAGVIVDPRFCAPYPYVYPVDLAIVDPRLTDGNFVITDVNGNLLFKVKEPVFSLHDKRILLDGYGSPVLTLRKKMVSLHGRWQVFRGRSTKQRDLLYTVKRSSMLQFKTKLDVFLSHNTEEKRCDFRVKSSLRERSCVVYAGEYDAILAQMHKKHTVQSVFLGNDNFSVTVYPNVDYAFIASLFVILGDVNREDRNVESQLITRVSSSRAILSF